MQQAYLINTEIFTLKWLHELFVSWPHPKGHCLPVLSQRAFCRKTFYYWGRPESSCCFLLVAITCSDMYCKERQVMGKTVRLGIMNHLNLFSKESHSKELFADSDSLPHLSAPGVRCPFHFQWPTHSCQSALYQVHPQQFTAACTEMWNEWPLWKGFSTFRTPNRVVLLQTNPLKSLG